MPPGATEPRLDPVHLTESGSQGLQDFRSHQLWA